jgi:5-carboxymethyl-2-hydroxymuconic-semialdehyde dehydrogenase
VSLAVEQFDNAGQVCLGAFRILVEDAIADEFLAPVWTRPGPRAGRPRTRRPTVTALVSRAHFERVDGFVSAALTGRRRAVARRLANENSAACTTPDHPGRRGRGQRDPHRGGLRPVLTVQTFAGEEQAIAMANNTRFGLAATLVTGDPERAERVSAALNAGTVWVNCFFVRDLGAPFGGNGKSGIGREGGTRPSTSTATSRTRVRPNGWNA